LKVLVDTNVILDVLLARESFMDAALEIFGKVERSEVEGFLCATTITTIDYLLTQSITKEKSKEALRHLLKLFEVAPVNRSVVEKALQSKVVDFENAVLEQAAKLVSVDVIVTRNGKDFRKSEVSACDPYEFLSMANG